MRFINQPKVDTKSSIVKEHSDKNLTKDRKIKLDSIIKGSGFKEI